MNSVKIENLVPGDELQCWMRLGFALEKRRKPNGEVFMEVPSEAQVASSSALTRFTAWVIKNDSSSRVLTVQLTRNNSHSLPFNDEMFVADINYDIFQRIRKISATTFEAKELGPRRVTEKSPFGGADFRHYRTVEEVKIK